jgi:FtsP/CotA-like multicopper oxidase with cupredoxin domain
VTEKGEGMSDSMSVDRRQFLKYAGGTLAAAGSVAWAGKILLPEMASAAPGDPPFDLFFGGTDGWIALPKEPAIKPFHPDKLAPTPFTTYIFGFRNLTGMTAQQRQNQKNHAQHSAPLFWVDQYDESIPNPVDGNGDEDGRLHNEFRIKLTNLGLALRPDLFDAHTLHWHGFRNVIPFYDGEPSGSVSVPTGREFTYVYRPRDPGTYMYHCHVEDVEHVHMGMTGLVFVRPIQDGNTSLYPSGKYMYNDGDGSTGFDREFAMFMSEVWAESHWADAHIQLPEWSDYRADFSMLNGRVYPDTIAPNGSIDPFNPVFADGSQATSKAGDTFDTVPGDLIPPGGWGSDYEHLQYQPHSSLVNCNGGERVALRFSNLGFREQAMTMTGIQMRVVGRDATPMLGRDGTDTSYETNTINVGPGESYDVIFEAPDYVGPGDYDTYMLYNRNYTRSNNLEPDGGFGGQATEVRVYPGNTVNPQQYPNDWGV